MFGEIAQEYHQKFWVFFFVFVVFEGRDTIPLSIETDVVDDVWCSRYYSGNLGNAAGT
jgi:hypothetical protein